MKYLAIPFKLLHRVVGSILSAITISTLVGGLALIILAFVVLVLATILGFFLWMGIFLIASALGSGLLALVRIFDPDYLFGRDNTATTVMKTMKSGSDGLRAMAKEHL